MALTILLMNKKILRWHKDIAILLNVILHSGSWNYRDLLQNYPFWRPKVHILSLSSISCRTKWFLHKYPLQRDLQELDAFQDSSGYARPIRLNSHTYVMKGIGISGGNANRPKSYQSDSSSTGWRQYKILNVLNSTFYWLLRQHRNQKFFQNYAPKGPRAFRSTKVKVSTWKMHR